MLMISNHDYLPLSLATTTFSEHKPENTGQTVVVGGIGVGTISKLGGLSYCEHALPIVMPALSYTSLINSHFKDYVHK